MEQLNLPLIEREENNVVIAQRAYDGYINATAMCQAVGKRLNHYLDNNSTKAFTSELSSDTGIPASELIQVVRGGFSQMQGTWVHPRVAMHLGQWASPKFAVLVSKWVVDWIAGEKQQKSVMPYHIKRYLINREKIPPTHFSMLDQMTLKLLAPLESRGYLLPDRLMPDISLGRMFSAFLRSQGYVPESFPTYTHEFDDGRRQAVAARLYPNELMTSFNLEVHNWIRDRSLSYFGQRDSEALPHLENIIAALPPPDN
ncbi:KilA-N domain-containing protein [Xenorhabdus bovienii]|uniref:KilA-N domain-containing protein n=1 Tax=Xenorhabdus bovienii TaxID=40576 RepID=UPI0023B134A1|nr:KilA-N domain-containing protein [Xenorhabdus bovienii]MDE9479676.1 KilA-N domain-containing protein [Xenorhabdus bovienii]MDE9532611.1 KilA-N domain-containing protein [Xenorhabdus bovienii]